MKVKIKRLHDNAIIPQCETPGSAGMDLYATDMTPGTYYTEYGTGLALEIPMGCVGLVFPRSSISKLPGMALANAVGVIDSDYRGEIKLRFRGNQYQVGDRVAQLIIMPYLFVDFEETKTLSDTYRGECGFGSTS